MVMVVLSEILRAQQRPDEIDEQQDGDRAAEDEVEHDFRLSRSL
jgi:hypothetical protein